MYSVRRLVVLFAVAYMFVSVPARGDDAPKGAGKMYGAIVKLTAVEGKRDELIAILSSGTKEMPGCLSYIVAKDAAVATAVWVTEVWEDEASHKASLSLPAVREASQRADR